jgi:hypothetical protein
MQNKLLKLFFLICLAAVSSSAVLFAQQERTVTGTVVDEANAALPGASIVVKGTTIGTASDMNGRFSLTVPEGATTLVITFIGMEPVEQPITSVPMMITMDLAKTEVDAVGSCQRLG